MNLNHGEVFQRIFAAGTFLLLCASSAVAVGFFDDKAQHQLAPERYRSPAWESLAWHPSPAQEAALVGGGADAALLAVASNFFSEDDAPPKYVRAMALAIANQLRPGDQSIRLADYQLKYRRQPVPVEAWADRAKLGAKLWELAWLAEDVGMPGTTAGPLLLDLAAAFDPSDLRSIKRYRKLSEGLMELRWAGTVRLPEGIDAPDIDPNVGADVASAADDATDDITEDAAPKTFGFVHSAASVLVPAAPGAASRFVRLQAESRQLDPDTLRRIQRERTKQMKNTKGDSAVAYQRPALLVDFMVGTANAEQQISITSSLVRARQEFMRGIKDKELPPDLVVDFSIASGGAVAAPERLSAAAGLLLEVMARGIDLPPDIAFSGGLGFGGTLQVEGSLGTDLLACGMADVPPADGMRPLLIVPVFAESSVADLAALGELRTLVDVQIVGCRRMEEAIGRVSVIPDRDFTRAVTLFAEIGRAAERKAPEELLRNALVRERLEEVLELCPEHLSAAQLLRLASGRGTVASLDGSVARLSGIENKVRALVARQLEAQQPLQISDGMDPDKGCAEVLSELRKLRPRVNPRSRGYADQLASVVEDLRDSIRSHRRGAISSARAENLRSSLDSLDLELASLGVKEPE